MKLRSIGADICCNRSPPRNSSHQALSFVQAPAKAKVARSIETQQGHRLAALTAFCIVDVPIMAARNNPRSNRAGSNAVLGETSSGVAAVNAIEYNWTVACFRFKSS